MSSGLNRVLNVFEAVSIAVSDISPTTGVFLMVPAVLAMAGTGSFVVTLVAGLIALCVALTMAELGSIFPIAGGIYSAIRRVLGRPIGFVALIAYLGEGIFIPSVTALGCASYITAVFPALNVNVTGLVVILVATGIAILNISASAKFTAVLLALEIIVVGVLTIAALFHIHQPISTLFSLENVSSSGALTHVSPAVIFTAVVVMLQSFNGYDSAITFSEETSGTSKNVGRVVTRAATIGILAQIIPLIFIMLAAPSIPDFLKSSSPISDVGKIALGGSASIIMDLGAASAMFACTIAVILQFARVLFASGRDQIWPGPISKSVAALHSKFRTPWVGALVLGIIGGAFCFWSDLGNLITFTSCLTVSLYALVAISSFVVHWRMKHLDRPYKIPLWPIPPLVALIGVIASLTQQSSRDLTIVGCIVITALIYYFAYLRRKERSLSFAESNVSGD